MQHMQVNSELQLYSEPALEELPTELANNSARSAFLISPSEDRHHIRLLEMPREDVGGDGFRKGMRELGEKWKNIVALCARDEHEEERELPDGC